MVEALVAITVLMIGVIGPLSLLANAITNANYAKNQITAFFLAQEGQELVINQRDQNILNGLNSGDPGTGGTANGSYWLTGGATGNGFRECIDRNANNTTNVKVCYIDAYDSISAGNVFKSCQENGIDGQCPNLKLKNGFYGYQADGTPTIFNRQIQIVPNQNPDPNNESEALVKVTVTWKERSLTRSFTLKSVIYRY